MIYGTHKKDVDRAISIMACGFTLMVLSVYL